MNFDTFKFNFRLFKKLSINAIIKFLGIFFNFLIFFTLAKVLDKSDFGLLQGALNLLLFLSSLFLLGLDFRFFEKANEINPKKNNEEFKSILIYLFICSFIFSFIFFLIIVAFYSKYLIFSLIIFCIPCMVGVSLISEFFKGLNQTVLFQILNQFLIYVLILIGFILLFFLNSLSLQHFIYLYFGSYFIVFMLALYLFRKNLVNVKFSILHVMNAMKNSLVYNLMKITSVLFLVIDILIIKFYTDSTAYSNYIFAQKIGQFPSIFLSILAIHSLPKLVSESKNNLQTFYSEYRFIMDIISFVITFIIPIFLIIIIFFINFYFDKYSESIGIMTIILISSAINLSTGPLGLFLTFTELKKYVLRINLIGYCVYILFCIMTFNLLEIYALALGYLITILISNIYLGYHFFLKYKKIPLIFLYKLS